MWNFFNLVLLFWQDNSFKISFTYSCFQCVFQFLCLSNHVTFFSSSLLFLLWDFSHSRRGFSHILGKLTNFGYCNLVTSGTGAPISGSAVDEINEVVGYVSLGYPFGMMASILFGRHHKAILQTPKPKLFVMGTRDGFTSVKQLQKKLSSAAGRVETHLIEGAGHFQMEGPAYDVQMVNLILTFIASL